MTDHMCSHRCLGQGDGRLGRKAGYWRPGGLLLGTLCCLGLACSAQGAPTVVVVPSAGEDVTVNAPADTAPVPSISPTATDQGVAWPNPRFTINGDGTVTDNLTGLIWLQQGNCISQNTGVDTDDTANDGLVTWQHALDFIDGLNAGTIACGDTSADGSNQSDWRLPNINELLSVLDYNHFGYALSDTEGTSQFSDGDPFLNMGVGHVGANYYWYWTSTTYAGNADQAWKVHPNSLRAEPGDKTGTVPYSYAWAVRGGN
jgi:hypothetical protein